MAWGDQISNPFHLSPNHYFPNIIPNFPCNDAKQKTSIILLPSYLIASGRSFLFGHYTKNDYDQTRSVQHGIKASGKSYTEIRRVQPRDSSVVTLSLRRM